MQALIGALAGFIPAVTALIWMYVHSRQHNQQPPAK